LTTKGSRNADHVVRMPTFHVERLIRANTQDVRKTMPKSQKMADQRELNPTIRPISHQNIPIY